MIYDLIICDWFSLVGLSSSSSSFFFFPSEFGFYLNNPNSFSWKTKFPVVPLSMLLSKLPSSIYKQEVWNVSQSCKLRVVQCILNQHSIKEERSLDAQPAYISSWANIHTYQPMLNLLWFCTPAFEAPSMLLYRSDLTNTSLF